MMVTKKLSTKLLTETLTKPMGKHKQSEPDNPVVPIDYLEAIAREAALLKTALESMPSITPATCKQIEVSVNYIDRNLRAIKAGYLYQPNTTRQT